MNNVLVPWSAFSEYFQSIATGNTESMSDYNPLEIVARMIDLVGECEAFGITTEGQLHVVLVGRLPDDAFMLFLASILETHFQMQNALRC
jgi:hypothetical protein